MREVKLVIRIDEKNNRIGVIEETINLHVGIDKELFLYGVYNYLLLRHGKKFNINKLDMGG